MSKNTEPLQNISESIQALYNIGQELISVMDKQIDAVICLNTDEVEKHTERHTYLKGQFKKYEKAFVGELEKKLGSDSSGIKLEALKKVFPDSASIIDEWKKSLNENALELQEKQAQLFQLLEFALDRNAQMMHSIYSIYNKNNTHYSSNGGKNDISSGMAINQEA